MKLWLPRLCEALTVRGMKDQILAAGTKFHNWGCPGQRTKFHLFVMRSLIALRLVTGFGYKEFFDKQIFIDTMHLLYKAKVHKSCTESGSDWMKTSYSWLEPGWLPAYWLGQWPARGEAELLSSAPSTLTWGSTTTSREVKTGNATAGSGSSPWFWLVIFRSEPGMWSASVLDAQC